MRALATKDLSLYVLTKIPQFSLLTAIYFAQSLELPQARNFLSPVDDIHGQDFLYYGILDFVCKTDGKATMNVLCDDYQKWRKELAASGGLCDGSDLYSTNHAYDHVRSIVKSDDYKQEMRGTKETQLEKTDPKYKMKKAAYQQGR